MAKVFQNQLVPNTCGVGLSSVFRHNQMTGGQTIKEMENMGGAGWHCASFTDDPQHGAAYKEAYADFYKKWQIKLQTKVRINTRTNRKFIFVVYDTQVPKAEIDNSKHKWPEVTMGV
jgi:hypothetical protein